MKWFSIVYDTIWLRCHPVWQDAHGQPLYPSWRAAWGVARIIASVK